MLAYARRFNRTWAAYARAGTFRAESERLRSVPVDPLVAELIGQFSTIEVFHAINTGFVAGGGLTGQWQHQALNFNFDRSVNPGNGLSLTALGQTASAAYSYSTRRNLSTGLNIFYSQLTPLLQGLDRSTIINGQIRQGQFKSYGAGGGIAYRLTSALYATANFETARVQYDSTLFGATRKTATVGLAFSPGEVPLRWR
ncbi:MAG: hypothetical protein OEW16_06215, partial [Gammaproteobacteria bacterium]|nr:hypothetical protein [Gammaproteobacteria bacterium]